MKLSYREKIGLLVVIVLVVIIVFIAWPIKTIRTNIKNDTAKREAVQQQYDETQRHFGASQAPPALLAKVFSAERIFRYCCQKQLLRWCSLKYQSREKNSLLFPCFSADICA